MKNPPTYDARQNDKNNIGFRFRFRLKIIVLLDQDLNGFRFRFRLKIIVLLDQDLNPRIPLHTVSLTACVTANINRSDIEITKGKKKRCKDANIT